MQPDIYNGDTTPKIGDSKNTLYKKILGVLYNTFGGQTHNRPLEGDGRRVLLTKILNVLNGT